MIRSIKFASIPVRDHDRAIEFYAGKLGFTVQADQPMGDGRRWVELGIPGAETRIVLFTPDGHENRIGTHSNVVFASDDVKASYEELSSRGVPFDREPTSEPWGTFTTFRDPDGNQFVLSSRR